MNKTITPKSPVVKCFFLSVIYVISERSGSHFFIFSKSNHSNYGNILNFSETTPSPAKGYFMCFASQHYDS